jgi:hypothetical protein
MGADRANRFDDSSYLNGEVQIFGFRESVVDTKLGYTS